MNVKEIAPRITVDETIHHGKPVIRGSRISVETILGQLSAGVPIEEVADAYAVTRDDVLACLAYATELLKNEHVRSVG